MRTIAAEIRYAAARDAEALSAVHASAWAESYNGLIPHRALREMIARRGTPWWDDALRRRSAVLVLEFDGEVAGYATLGRNRTRALLADGELYELYLRPEYQGLGFGRDLFEASRSLLASRGLTGLAVWALEENSRALGFYRALGGTDIATGSEVFDGKAMRKIAFLWPSLD